LSLRTTRFADSIDLLRSLKGAKREVALACPRHEPRIRLPNDLSRSLKYLDDGELLRLRDAVKNEIERRSQLTGSTGLPRPTRRTEEAAQIPEGQQNLIRASLKAGLKPAAIARSLGISPSVIGRVLQSKGDT
jgi:hypothetical protein